jgi:hypothetical protein
MPVCERCDLGVSLGHVIVTMSFENLEISMDALLIG